MRDILAGEFSQEKKYARHFKIACLSLKANANIANNFFIYFPFF